MNTLRRTFVAAAATLLSFAAALPASAQTAPKVEGAWARPTVAGQAGGGGFLKITSPTADRLIAASAPVSKTVELHTMQMEGDVMRMREVPAIEIPAGRTVELKPGGLHVMFIGLTQTLNVGATFPLTLRFEKAGEVKVDVKVMTSATMPATTDHKH
ncbi:MAG: copper chaperone PCu(A)C [Rubrivivax sp.]|nr:copper chaperone PCu(A)C [Rubrivivax sp.]